MVTFVASLFLPYSVDFHEFDDPDEPRLKKLPSTRSNSNLNLAGLELGHRKSASSLLHENDVTSPKRPQFVQRKSIVDLLNLNETEIKQVSRPVSPWMLTDNKQFGNFVDPGVVDRPNTQLDSIVSSLIQDQGLKRFDTVGRKATSPSFTNKHSSLAFVDENEPLSSPLDANWNIDTAVLVNGGLVNAVRGSPEGKQTETIWIGALSGVDTDRISTSCKEEITAKFAQDFNAQVIYIPDEDMNGHYEHFCKIVLWPVLHYHMPDNVKSKAYEDHSWKYYLKVNQIFADKIVASYKHGDTIWIHDYHLMLVPDLIRQKVPDAEIGFFLHTGFPSSELFRCVSSRKELLRGMLGANLVGFQTQEYAKHFLQTCSRVLVTETTRDGVLLDDRHVRVSSQPIGIVHEAIDVVKQQKAKEIRAWVKQIEATYEGKILIVARDKLDSVRGIRQKLLAYELFLAKNPDLREKVVLMQVATSTTALIELQSTVYDIVFRINEQYATFNNTPLEFVTRDMPFANYIAMISAADVLMVTSVREGMGLTAQEFIYCQDGSFSSKSHGQVILSEFTGTSTVFAGNELSCNPWDIRDMAKQIEKAVRMEEGERIKRWKRLRTIVDHNTGGKWWAALQNELRECYNQQHNCLQTNIPRLDNRLFFEQFSKTSKRLLIIDSEGTATSDPIDPGHHESLRRVLVALTSDASNVVYMTSALSPPILEELYADIPALGLIAENGMFTHHPNTPPFAWEEADPSARVRTWKSQIAPFLSYFLGATPGARLQERWTSLLIDYSGAEHQRSASRLVSELLAHVNETCKSLHLRAIPLEKSVLIEGLDRNKATAVAAAAARYMKLHDDFEHDHGEDNNNNNMKRGFDMLFLIGDGREDEVLFKWGKDVIELQKTRGRVLDFWSVSIGNRTTTEATCTLDGGQGAVLYLLKKIASISKGHEGISRGGDDGVSIQ